jgi:hypothetical protein
MMATVFRCVLAFCLAVSLAPLASARDAALLSFDSEAGMARLARADARADFATLANHFEPQVNGVFCGPATAAILLNALYIQGSEQQRFTQESVIAKGRKTRAQVLGEPVIFNGRPIKDYGYQLRQLDELLRAHGLATRMVVVDDRVSEAEVRAALAENLARRGDFVVVNYRRGSVGQGGGGHISPLGAYDAVTDSFLVLDVNPAAAGWAWIAAPALIDGMRTFDSVENRGFILVSPR